MPQNLTDVSEWTAPIVAMADSDPADAVYPRLLAQGLANRTKFLADSLGGFIISRGDVYRASTTEFGWDGTDLFAGGRFMHLAAGSVDIGTPTASTWIYLYVYSASGVATVEHSTTAPESATGYRFKTGDPTRVYLGCAYADGSNVLVPFRSRRGRYTYQPSAIATFPGRFLITTGDAWTDRALGVAVPPHARSVRLLLHTYNTHSTQWALYVRTNGDTAGALGVIANAVNGAAAGISDSTVDLPCDSSATIEYQTDDGAGAALAASDLAQIVVLGFDE